MFWLTCWCLVTLPTFLSAQGSETAETEAAEAKTVEDPSIPVEELELRLQPLRRDQLQVEAEAWLALLQAKMEEISTAQIEQRQKKEVVDAAEEAAEAAEEAEKAREEAQKVAEEGVGDRETAEQAATARREAEEAAAEAERAAAELAKQTQGEAPAASQGEGAATDLEATTRAAEEAADTMAEQRDELLDKINGLMTERAELVEKLRVVTAALKEKGGDVAEYDLFIESVPGFAADLTDATASYKAILGWLTSEEHGLKYAKNLAVALVILVVAFVLSKLAAAATRKALSVYQGMSGLLRNFLLNSVRRVVMAIGLVMAIGALGIDMGPLLAVVAGATFVIGFALQDTLGNFASGMMIMIYRPFDVGDIVELADVSGHVEAVNLVSTSIRTFDNKSVIVPNNSVWGGVITNATGVTQRRVDMVFGIGYEDDIAKAQSILEEIVASHELVLKDPEPIVKVHELADSSVNFVCRPWCTPLNYWDVYWDITRAVKERFDREGVSIPFPQRDVHLYSHDAGTQESRSSDEVQTA